MMKILLTFTSLFADGSPVKNIQKEILKKGEGLGGLKGHPPSLSSASRGQQQQAGALHEATPQQPKNDEPTDCYLKDLYNQINSVVMSKPDERDNINEGESGCLCVCVGMIVHSVITKCICSHGYDEYL